MPREYRKYSSKFGEKVARAAASQVITDAAPGTGFTTPSPAAGSGIPGALAEPDLGTCPKRARPRRRRAAIVLWAVAAVTCFAVYLRLARTTAVNSDGAAQVLQAWDMLHGNLLLSGWNTTDVSFYTTEVPEDLLILLARGLRPDVVQIGAAATYTLIVLLGVALAKGTATGRTAAGRIALAGGILLAPELVWGTHELVSSPDHIGTTVPVMLTWLILERAPRRWWVPVLTTALLAWSVIADQLVLVIAILPLIGVAAVRFLRSTARWFEISLAVGGLVAALVSLEVPRVIHALGGYHAPAVLSGIAPTGRIIDHNLPLTGKGLLILFGAYLPGLPGSLQTWVAMLHVVSLVLVACAVAVTAWRFFRGEDLIPQLLLAGIVLVLAAYVTGVHAAVLENAREISCVVPFGAVLAARQFAPRLAAAPAQRRRIAVPVLAVVLAGYVVGLAAEMTVPAVPPENARLTAWLIKHPLGGTGLSGYWEANVVTLTSGGRVAVRPLGVPGGQVIDAYSSETKTIWWDPARSYADFIVLGRPANPYGYPGFTRRDLVTAKFGQPARVYRVGSYTILWWHKNLLTDLASGPRPQGEPGRAGSGRAG
jgi:hypothetical protein